MACSLETKSPGPPDSLAPVTTFGEELDHGKNKSRICTLEPYSPSTKGESVSKKSKDGDERILYVDSLSSKLNCGKLVEMFGKYG